MNQSTNKEQNGQLKEAPSIWKKKVLASDRDVTHFCLFRFFNKLYFMFTPTKEGKGKIKIFAFIVIVYRKQK